MDAWIPLAEKQAAICSVFANPKRVLILWTLVDQEKTVTDIAMSIDASLQSTSQHLNLMKERRILESRRDGQLVYYRIAENESLSSCGMICPENRE